VDEPKELLRKQLQGSQRVEIEKRDYDWLFKFDTGCSIAIESLWRLVSDRSIEVTSQDHGHQFGLPAPVDAGVLAKEKIGQDTVEKIDLNFATSDLTFTFSNGKVLQFISTSSGYEAWNFFASGMQVIGRNGDRIIFPRE
jgi:hypothetical protein